jgi:hypothetical protein
MFTIIGAALGQPTTDRDRQPVRRQSFMAGRCEGVFWRRTDHREVRRVVLAARRYELAGRIAGRRNGPLGHVGIEVLDLLANLMDRRTGRLEPSVAWLMERLKRSKDAIVRALEALRVHGFLDRLRRFEPTGCQGRGPQIRQVSNAYRLVMPPRALRLLGATGQDVPLPDDLAQEREAQAMEVAAMKASLSLEELAAVEVDDDRLGRLLGQLGRLVQERDPAKQEETRTTVSY